RIGDLLLQLRHQLLEGLARLPVDEVVVLQLLDAGAGVGWDFVEPIALVLQKLAQRIHAGLIGLPALAGLPGLTTLAWLVALTGLAGLTTLAALGVLIRPRLAGLPVLAGFSLLPLLESLVEGRALLSHDVLQSFDEIAEDG